MWYQEIVMLAFHIMTKLVCMDNLEPLLPSKNCLKKFFFYILSIGVEG